MNSTNLRTTIIALAALAVGVAAGAGATELKTKTGKTPEVSPSQPAVSDMSGQTTTDVTWDPFQQIRDVQMQMDKMLSQMSTEFRSQPEFSRVAETPAYSLSLNVEDLKNRFIVHAYLPDAKASAVNVNLENQTLKFDVNSQQERTSKEKGETTQMVDWGQYEQVIHLPAPVKAGQMKIDRKDHELTITLPKQ